MKYKRAYNYARFLFILLKLIKNENLYKLSVYFSIAVSF